MSRHQPALDRALEQVPRRYVERVDLRELEDWPGNPKDHDVGAILESMQQNGVVDPLYVMEWPGQPLRIIAGHGKRKTLLQAGVTHSDCIFFEIAPEAAGRYVLASNRASERGGWEQSLLADYLTAAVADHQLLGTGFDTDDVEEQVRMVTRASFDDRPTQEPAEPRKDLRIKITVEEPDKIPMVAEAVEAYLSEHPDWGARVVE